MAAILDFCIRFDFFVFSKNVILMNTLSYMFVENLMVVSAFEIFSQYPNPIYLLCPLIFEILGGGYTPDLMEAKVHIIFLLCLFHTKAEWSRQFLKALR